MSEISYAAALLQDDKTSVRGIIAKSGDITAIGDFPNLTSLDLSGNTQVTDFGFLSGLPALEELYLSNMDLGHIPKELCELPELCKLHLGGNSIKDFSLLKTLPNLVDLGLESLDLRKIPDDVVSISGLKVLGLYDNDITSITSLKKLPLLEELFIASNRLKKIPKELKKLEHLRLLDIMNNNFLTDIGVVGELAGLEDLGMTHPPDIEIIPDAVFELSALKKLTLHLRGERGDKLEGMKNIGNLQGLEELWIVGAGIEALPAGFSELKKLKVLKLTSNKSLADIDALKDLPVLEELDLHSCDLRKIPASFSTLKALKKLDISLNDNLTDVSGLRDLPGPEELTFYSKLSSFPDSMGTLTGLKKLVLTSESAEVGFLSTLTALEELMLKDCSFEALPVELGGLKTLSVYRDKGDDAYLTNFGELEELNIGQHDFSLPAMPKLKTLWITDIEGIIDFGNISASPLLEKLTIKGADDLEALPIGLSEAKGLQTLKLSFLDELKDISELRDMPNLRHVEMMYCESLKALPEGMATLGALQILELSEMDSLADIAVIGEMKALVELKMDNVQKVKSLPPGMKEMSGLRVVRLEDCCDLKDISVLEEVASLEVFECDDCKVSTANKKKVTAAMAGRQDKVELKMSYQEFMDSGHYKTLSGKEDAKHSYSFPLDFDTPESLLESMGDFDWLDDFRDGDFEDENEDEDTLESAILNSEEGGLKPLAILDFGYKGCEDVERDSYCEEIFLVDIDDPNNAVFLWTHDGSPAKIHANFDLFLASLRDFKKEEDDDDDESQEEDTNTTYLEFVDEKSSKFWQVTVSGSSHTVVYGKIGSNGSSKTKEFADEAAALKDALRLTKSKEKKGYAAATRA
ncbi:MAG: leucine-rich repeat domain-containing protein [Kofleriaceae bacterium]|nr:leucine-rich repeat domain-containing protein [Kofleriaceae bacterium]